GPAHFLAAARREGGTDGIERAGILRPQSQHIVPAGGQGQRGCGDQEVPPLNHARCIHETPHLGSYPLRRSPNNSLVGVRLGWSDSWLRLATSRRVSPIKSDICASPSPLMKASASSATLPYLT